MILADIADGVHRLAACEIRVGTSGWPFAAREAEDIRLHWQRRSRETPTFFNGRVYVMVEGALRDGCLTGTLAETDFASSLYWRETGFRDRSVVDCFGAAILQSADEALIFGRQSAGNVNSGLSYPPSGFIDPRDVDSGGVVALDRSVTREIAEETGLDAALLLRAPGYLMARSGSLMAVGIVFRSQHTAAKLVAEIEAVLATEAQPELAGVVALYAKHDIAQHPMPAYGRLFAEQLLPD